ncbi:MerR family transcriptional regulator [Occultella gossypii]|uniref:MerR family transcriptional regulator n=1 Tax=Occultella gossypii TaxID=2800820 RepID=A0ABS7SGK8_9MICO|nr:MerR family transcriptional regulator [Occultella gossypii]MBZ2198865.1 MerR family transcriptional regulator [Occultella gossypii]
MSTDLLVAQLLDAAPDSTGAPIGALHRLLDDSAIDESDPAKSIAEAAALVGLSPTTLRYYERQQLVRPARNAAGHREYSALDLRRLVFIARMRLSGMSMQELTRYIALVDDGHTTQQERQQIMSAQRDRILHRIRELTLALEVTEYKIRTYGAPE